MKNTETARTLATEFKDGGFDYRQIKRQGNAAIFEQSKCGIVVAYEVAVIRVKPGRKFPGGRTITAYEAYPANTEWGQFAWTCSTLARAEERFQGLVRVAG